MTLARCARGYIFAEGTRNSFDFAFAPNGDLFATENGPDRDMSEELNWLRPGLHYGFPWRIGGADNPQQFPNYDPAPTVCSTKVRRRPGRLLSQRPDFPPPPTNFTEPIINVGRTRTAIAIRRRFDQGCQQPWPDAQHLYGASFAARSGFRHHRGHGGAVPISRVHVELDGGRS